ncbi:BOW99_gp33 family protein [Streptococcus ruminantium]|uniref:BOW99_gp33 family protein n=1 Tax=Streptococcus ruminantium TaxID=1917441 RepID=UPI0012DE23D3|nr:hypothetical protein [Streptococcus ruminantium]
MTKKKEQWTPKVTSLRKVIVDGEEQWVEFDPATYVIPAGHPYYDIIRGINKEVQRKKNGKS